MLKKIAVLLIVLGLAFGVLVLTTQESRFTVQSARKYQISQEQLWQVLAEVEQWPRWWPGAESAGLDGSFSSGSEIRLSLKGVSPEKTARLIRVDNPHEFSWERVGVLKSRVGTSFRLESIKNGTLLRIENFICGPQAVLAHITGEEAFRKYQRRLLENLDHYLQSKLIAGREKD